MQHISAIKEGVFEVIIYQYPSITSIYTVTGKYSHKSYFFDGIFHLIHVSTSGATFHQDLCKSL